MRLLAVPLDGALRGAQLIGNLLVQPATNHQVKDLALCWSERVHARAQIIELLALRTVRAIACDGTLDR